MQLLHPKHWPRARGFSHGVALGPQCSWPVRWAGRPASELVGDDFVAQVEQALTTW